MPAQQGDGQLAAQVLAEVVQAVEHAPAGRRPRPGASSRSCQRRQAQRAQQRGGCARSPAARQQPGLAGVAAVEQHADGRPPRRGGPRGGSAPRACGRPSGRSRAAGRCRARRGRRRWRCGAGAARRSGGSGRASASRSQAASAAALASIQSKKRGSRISATLTASASPAMASRRGSRSRKRASLMTAKGGTKVPRKFLAPKALIPFFTPTPESFWPSTVVGIADGAQAAVGGGGGVPGGVHAPRRRRRSARRSGGRCGGW